MDRLSQRTAYDPVAKWLHWFVVALVVVQYLSAWVAPNIRRATPTDALVSAHLSLGVILIGVVLVRFLWRLTHRPPALGPEFPRWQAGLSHAVHLAIYALLFIVPVVGWAYATSAGWEVTLFNAVHLPAFPGVDHAVERSMRGWHNTTATLLGILVGVHITAALYHHFIEEDGILYRMLPARFSS